MPSSLMCLFLALGLSLVPVSLAEPSPSDAWTQARLKWEAGELNSAQELLTQLVKVHESQGIRSSEPHYNLGRLFWQLKQPGKANYHLLKSAALSSSLLDTLSTVSTIEGIEREIGVREGVSEGISFSLYLLLKDNWLQGMLCVGLWGLIFAWLVSWLQGPRAKRAAILAAILPIALILFSSLAYLFKKTMPRLAVIESTENTRVIVYRDPEKRIEDKPVELPSGTVITVGRTEKNFSEILSPIYGWVEQTNLLIAPRS